MLYRNSVGFKHFKILKGCFVMTKLILITLLLLTGCTEKYACIDGKLWENVYDFSTNGEAIYTRPFNIDCKETK